MEITNENEFSASKEIKSKFYHKVEAKFIIDVEKKTKFITNVEEEVNSKIDYEVEINESLKSRIMKHSESMMMKLKNGGEAAFSLIVKASSALKAIKLVMELEQGDLEPVTQNL